MNAGIVVDAGVDLERDAVAQVIHAARRDGEAERERLQDPRVVRIALHQPLHRHPVLQRLRRVVPALDRARAVGDDVAEAFAARHQEQQLLDRFRVAPRQIEPAGLLRA